VFAAVCLGPRSASAQAGGGSGIVRQIVIEGSQRVEPETIKSYLLIREGDPFDAGAVDRSLKSLFSTGLFADVSFTRRADTLVINVVENPVINRIAFEGNKRRTDKDLEAEVTLKPRVIFTRTKVQADVKRLLDIYRQGGRFNATVEPKIIELPQNRVDLVFEIDEGDATGVANIRFIGNKQYNDSSLRDVIRTKETRWFRFLTSDDSYDPDRLTLDRELLRRFYLKNGFADFRVTSAVAELTPEQKEFFITFTVDEGQRYKFGKINVDTQIRDLDASSLVGELEIESGDWYNADAVEKSVDKLTDAVGTKGFAFGEVRPRVTRNRDAKTVDISFEVREGPRVYVERIDITGNVRTLDRVVRREFRLVEGDAFNSAKLRRSRQRVQNLDFFDKVTIDQVPGSTPDRTVVKVGLQEKSTGALTVGIGYSTLNGPLVDTGIRERNLLGRGQDIRLSGAVSSKRTQINLGFTEPYFMDREVAAGFDVFHTTSDQQKQSSYDSTVTGFNLRAGYPITENLSQRWVYTIKETDVSDVDSDASIYVRSQEGTNILSQIAHILTYDRRDSSVNPTSGYIVKTQQDLAGLGGDSEFIRNTVEGAQYWPYWDDWVASVRAKGGYIVGIGKDVRLTERFFVGGEDVRGFDNAGIGPRDAVTQDALGGEWMYTGSAETTFPFPGFPKETGFRGRLFTDVGSSGKIHPSDLGNVNDTGSIRVSAGFGGTWVSPFGAIGLDLGWPIKKENFDDTQVFRLNLGTRF
jgi:outer membrane protein insertion porin family